MANSKTDGHIEDLQNKVSKLDRQIEGFQDTKREMDKSFKNEFRKISEQIIEMQQRLKQLQVKLKEKDQECKIAELKIKELKKQMPHPKLRQMSKIYRQATQQKPYQEQKTKQSVSQPPRKVAPVVREDSGDVEIFLTHVRERSIQPEVL